MSLREGTGESGTALGGLVKKRWFKKCDHGCMTRIDGCSNSGDCGSDGVAPPYFPLVVVPMVVKENCDDNEKVEIMVVNALCWLW